MALVRWLKDNKDVIKYQYYYDGSSESKHPDYYQGIYSTRETDRYRVAGKYFYFGCCKSAVENYLKEKSLGEKQQAIIEIDPITRRNTFHTLFTTELYPSLTTGPKDYYISWAHWSDLKSLALNDEISYWSDNKHYLRYKAQHEECIQNNQLTSATNKDYRKNSLSNLFTFLLSQFEKADDSLMKAFLQHDERGNTPLFYAFQKYTNEFNYDSLHEFLQKSGTANTGRLYLEPNQYDKTLLHVIFSLSTDDSLEWHMDLLDPATIKDAFRAKDQVGNTPLHDLFLLRKKLTNTFVEKVCQAIKTASENTGKQGEMEQKQDQLPDYLTVNLDNANPLHYLCQRDPRNEENLSMLKTMLQFAGHLKSEKIMQQDKFHMTPVHYAIKSGNFSLAEEMLNRLMGQDQLNLILMKHNKHETLLHFICQYGNPALLEQAILIIGPLKCYEIRKQVPLKASSSNKNLSQEQLESTVNKYSRLFNTFDYFVEKYKKGVFATPDTTKRFEDFCGCYPRIQLEYELPEASHRFYNNRIIGTETYHGLRHEFRSVTSEERADFMSYISSMKAKEEARSRAADENETGSQQTCHTSPEEIIAVKIHESWLRSFCTNPEAIEQKIEPRAATHHLPENVNGENYLHAFCRGTFPNSDPESLNAELKKVPEAYRPGKILRADRYGMTPAHYALRNKRIYLVNPLLTHLNSEQQQNLLSMKYNQKETMLHDICQFGDADLLKKAIDILGPEKLHQIRSELPPKAHASNPNLPQEQIDRFMKAENRLFDTFDYLVKRFNPDVNLSQQPEFQKRLDDFCLCLTALKNNARIPVKNDFQAKTAGFGVFSVNYGGTYNALRLFLENATQREQKEFSTYISALPSDTKGNSTPAGRTLAEHINRKLKELEPKSEVRAQPPLQDGGPVYAVTPSAPPEPSLVAAAHAGPPGGPATTTTNTTVTVGSMTVVPPEGAAPSAASATVTIRTRSPSKGRV